MPDQFFPDLLNRFADEADREEEKEDSIPEIVVTAAALAKPAVKSLATEVSEFGKLLQKGGSDFQKLLKQPYIPKQKPVLDVITVVGKRASPLIRGAGWGVPLEIFARLGAAISDDISQAKLDDAFATLMAENVKKKYTDTPVKTIKAKPLDEIIVKGKRDWRPKAWDLPERMFNNLDSFQLNPLFDSAAAPTFAPISVKRPQIVSKKTPKLRTISDFSKDPLTRQLPFAEPSPLTRLIAMPSTRTRPELRQPMPRNLTGINAPGVGLGIMPRTSAQLSGTCPPCPKKTETKKKRKKCYKTLVKQARDPRNDKTYNWVEINCDSGREIRKY